MVKIRYLADHDGKMIPIRESLPGFSTTVLAADPGAVILAMKRERVFLVTRAKSSGKIIKKAVL